jgi:hypothetical protein
MAYFLKSRSAIFATAGLVDFFAFPQLEQGFQGGLDHVGGIAGPERFGKNVFDSGGFDDGTGSASSDQAGSFRSWL